MKEESPAATRLLFSDLLGLSHGKTVPPCRSLVPTHYAITVMVQGLDLEFLEIDGYSTEEGFPDMEARVDKASLRPSWGEGMVAMTDLYRTDGTPLALCPRTRLREHLDQWRGRGLHPRLGYEMEFFLKGDTTPESGPLAVPWHRVYGTGPGADPSGLSSAIEAACMRAQLEIEGVNSEFEVGQLEAALHYTDALSATDQAFLFRELVRETALAHGLGATFMARPFNEAVGNGMHINLSAADDSGNNLFSDESDHDGISDLCRHAIAGMLEHHAALSALMAPTVNSYKRLRPGMLAGYYANWGLDNRLVSVRVPGQRGVATRIEHRSPDGSAAPHLAALGILAAALDGIERELEPPPPAAGNAENAPGTEQHTAESLSEALDLLEDDDVLTAALGPDATSTFVGLKRAEVDNWRQHVTDWEVSTYGRIY